MNYFQKLQGGRIVPDIKKLSFEYNIPDILKVSMTMEERLEYIKNQLFECMASHLISNLFNLPIQYQIMEDPLSNQEQHSISMYLISETKLKHLQELENNFAVFKDNESEVEVR